jgi:hypothetical protein
MPLKTRGRGEEIAVSGMFRVDSKVLCANAASLPDWLKRFVLIVPGHIPRSTRTALKRPEAPGTQA